MDKLTVLLLLWLFVAVVHAEQAETTGADSMPQSQDLIPPALLEKVADGHAESAFFIGSAFAKGTMGIEPDLDQAREWFLKSAQLGYVHGMFEIGKLLYQDKLYGDAKDWFEQAAGLGHGESYYRMALYPIYELDETAFDCQQAYQLLQQAQLRDVKAAYNDHAWMLATLPDKKCRNGQKAWKIFAELQSMYGRMEPIPWAYLDTKAAVLAEIADYNEAIEVQSWIVEDFCDVDFTASDEAFNNTIDRLTKGVSEGENELCLGAAQRLQSYVKRQPWREEPEYQ